MLLEDSDELLTHQAEAVMEGFNQVTEFIQSLQDSEERLKFAEQASYEFMQGMVAALFVLVYVSAPERSIQRAEYLFADARELARAKIEGVFEDPPEIH
tara:strand:+ start:103 stop:399 length:297 start_codon:yes stop_codon:yes gene_type:complete